MLAEELVKAVPCAEQVRFTTSGTDACFQAMRAARAYRKRDKVLKFEGGFHGTSDYALMSVTPSASEEFPQAVPSSAGIPKAIQDLMLIAPFNDLETTTLGWAWPRSGVFWKRRPNICQAAEQVT